MFFDWKILSGTYCCNVFHDLNFHLMAQSNLHIRVFLATLDGPCTQSCERICLYNFIGLQYDQSDWLKPFALHYQRFDIFPRGELSICTVRERYNLVWLFPLTFACSRDCLSKMNYKIKIKVQQIHTLSFPPQLPFSKQNFSLKKIHVFHISWVFDLKLWRCVLPMSF